MLKEERTHNAVVVVRDRITNLGPVGSLLTISLRIGWSVCFRRSSWQLALNRMLSGPAPQPASLGMSSHCSTRCRLTLRLSGRWTCTYSNDFYSQCLPATTSSSIATTSKTSTSASTTSKTSTTSTTSSAATPSSSGAGPSKLVGQLPALGWNSWNAYQGDINETKVCALRQPFLFPKRNCAI